ncbi:hypothetical protein [Salinimicrobium oceani]|uniref:Lipoprotein n=1 Tax=Salinimicrobium oceani TaxID=2722702 RepID=A0ABX1CYD8_9FLAO|nr:hypothetical protein [Salinimicrobium oceani]NJW53285.1 hypothetical protein [Salinimicrobium oceani]
MKSKFLVSLNFLILLVLLSCGTTSVNRSMKPIERQAIDIPEKFDAPHGVTRTSNACVSPLTDPRDGTTIKMYSSFGSEEVGDYTVPVGRYGVGEDELLRINCRTGVVMGIVKK